jgi:hypothetical protein
MSRNIVTLLLIISLLGCSNDNDNDNDNSRPAIPDESNIGERIVTMADTNFHRTGSGVHSHVHDITWIFIIKKRVMKGYVVNTKDESMNIKLIIQLSMGEFIDAEEVLFEETIEGQGIRDFTYTFDPKYTHFYVKPD